MTKNPKQSKVAFDTKKAKFMAEEYLKYADRSKQLSEQQEGNESNASISLAISNFAFAIEIYLKVILYIRNNKAVFGHNLNKLWNKVDENDKNWIREVFLQNFDAKSETWNVLVTPSVNLKGIKNLKIKTPRNTADGILEGHKDAFVLGRYAFERPYGQKINYAFFQLRGLKLLAWLIREIAIMYIKTHEDVQKLNTNMKVGDKVKVELQYPKEISSFPSL